MRRYLLLFISLLFIVISFKGSSLPFLKADYRINEISEKKNVVMIMIDSMTGEILREGFKNNNFPALQFLAKNGMFYDDLVAPIPSMSVTIESTILTGTMPNFHRIPGLTWYKPEENRLVNYGSTLKAFLKIGPTAMFEDVIYNLNNEHLSKEVSTVFEDLHNRGRTSGAVNTLVYRGSRDYEVMVPTLLRKITHSPRNIELKGPDVLAFGKLVQPELMHENKLPDSIFQKYGLNDEYSSEVTQTLIRQNKLPDFSIVYFPDFDKKAHKHGPMHIDGLKKADQYLGEVLDAYGSWEKAIKEDIFIVIGDHGQDNMIKNKEKLTIDLDDIYEQYEISRFSGNVDKGEIAFGNNHRLTYVYSIDEMLSFSNLANIAMNDNRIALSAWIENNWINVTSPDVKGNFKFKSGGKWRDKYNQEWTIDGNPNILSIEVHSENKLRYGDYPDILNQIESALKSHDVPVMILASKPGFSFYSEAAPIHKDGGEHGGIHKNDTLSAMIITGTDEVPHYRRMVDLKSYILSLFDEKS